MRSDRLFARLSLTATLLTLVVVVLGAYVRLTDAGLGCPDWPGCYGHLGVPADGSDIERANSAFPDRPVEAGKGWREMIHRYVAGGLILTVFALAALAWRQRRQSPERVGLAFAGAVLIVGQALLGMWTVTWKLKPLIVMAHLLGGLTILSLLWWQTLRAWQSARAGDRAPITPVAGLRPALVLGLVVLVGQIALGGWTSANYAAVACNEFPACTLGEYWPERADFGQGFTFWHGIGPDYEFGLHLDQSAKIAIHLVHRLGALVVTALLLALAWSLWRAVPGVGASRAAFALTLALAVQVLLGIGNVVYNLPLAMAVAHNAGAAALLLVMVTLNALTRHPEGQ